MFPRVLATFWAAVTFYVLWSATSALLFSNPPRNFALYFKRLGLALVWPLALGSKAGRDLIFNIGGIENGDIRNESGGKDGSSEGEDA